jgi:hypothetical protein
VRKTGGYVAIGFGIFMGIGVLAQASSRHGIGALLFGFAVFCVIPVAFGALLLRASGHAR